MSSFSQTPLVIVAILGLILGLAQPVRAEPTVAEKEAARTAFGEGDEAYDEGDYDKALSSYRAAHEIMRIPPTGFAVAEALEKLGRLVEARDACVAVIQLPEGDREPKTFAEARDGAKKLSERLAERIPTLDLKVSGLPDDVTPSVKVDGQTLSAAVLAVALRLDPGEHTIEASADGFETVEKKVVLEESKAAELTITLEPEAPSVPQGPMAPEMGTAASVARLVPPEALGGDTGVGDISPVAWVGFGIGGAGLIAGAITGGIALSQGSSLQTVCGSDNTCPSFTEDDIVTATALAHVSTASFAVGGAGVALGLIGLFALGGGESEPVSVEVGPTGATLTGRF